MQKNEKRTFLSKGLKLEYEVWGEGIPFVFLHGMGGSIEQIRKVYEPFTGLQVIVPNQQGHGDSETDSRSLDFDHMADDILVLLEELKIETAHFAGISMGAAVCLNFAVRYPQRVKKLLLIRNAWMEEPMEKEKQIAYADMGNCLKTGGIEAFYRTEGWKIVQNTSPYTKNAFTCTFTDPACLKYWEKYLILPEKAPVTSAEEIRKIQIPTTIIANKNDFCHPFSYGVRLHQLIPNSEFFEIPDKDQDSAGHTREINRILRKWTEEELCRKRRKEGTI